MKQIICIIFILMIVVAMTGCNNTLTKNFGGVQTITLKPNEKLENITWKDDDSLWCLTRPMREDEEAETYSYKQHSNFGIVEGEVTIIEVKE